MSVSSSSWFLSELALDLSVAAMLFGGLNWQNKPLDDVWQVQLDIGAESPDEDGFESEYRICFEFVL